MNVLKYSRVVLYRIFDAGSGDLSTTITFLLANMPFSRGSRYRAETNGAEFSTNTRVHTARAAGGCPMAVLRGHNGTTIYTYTQ